MVHLNAIPENNKKLYEQFLILLIWKFLQKIIISHQNFGNAVVIKALSNFKISSI